MDGYVNDMIAMARTYMNRNNHKNYENAERIFLNLLPLELDQNTRSYIEYLLNFCRMTKVEHLNKLRDCKPETKGTANHTKYSQGCLEYEGGKGGGPLFRGGSKDREKISPYCKENEIRDQFESKTIFTENRVMNTQYEARDTINEDKKIQRPVEHLHHKERAEGGMYTAHDSQYDKINERGEESGLKWNSEGRKIYEQTPADVYIGCERGGNKEEREKITRYCKEDKIIDHFEFSTNTENRVINTEYEEKETIYEGMRLDKFKHKERDEDEIYTGDRSDKVNNLGEKGRKDCEGSRQQEKSCGEYVRKEEEILQSEHNYLRQNNDNYVLEIETDPFLKEQAEKEAEMLRLSLTLRAYVLQIGIDAFRSKPNYRQDVNFEFVSRNIDDLILRARDSFYVHNKIECEYYLSTAEKMYCEVAIILPQASISKPKTETNTRSENNKPETTTENSTVNIKSISYKDFVRGDDIDVIKCLKLAESALMKKDFKKAERLIKKSERICPTKNARELLKNLDIAKQEAAEQAARQAAEQAARQAAEKAAKKAAEEAARQAADQAAKTAAEQAARQAEKQADRQAAEQAAQKAAEQAAIKAAEQAAKKAAEQAAKESENQAAWQSAELTAKAAEEQTAKDAEIQKAEIEDVKKAMKMEENIAPEEVYVIKNSQSLNLSKKIVDKPAAKQCIDIAQAALDNNDFTKAERFILKANRLDPDIDIENLISQIRNALASRSSTEVDPPLETEDSEIVFQPTEDNKLNSKQLIKISDDFLKKNNIRQAEQCLLKASGYYTSINLEQKLKHIENLKKSQKLSEGFNKIPEPCFINSNSETRFASDPSQEVLPSYHIAKNLDTPEVCLKKGRMALTKGNLEKAKEYAHKSETSSPVRAQGLLHDININKNKNQGNSTLRSRSGRTCRDPMKTDNNSEVIRLITAAEQEISEGNLHNAEDFLNKAEKLQPSTNAHNLLVQINNMRLKAQSEHEAVHIKKQDPALKSRENMLQTGKHINPNRNNIRKLIEEAKEAYSLNDLDTAERLFKNANDIRPDKKLQSFINKIKNEREKILNNTRKILGEDINNLNEQEAKNCVESAQQAFDQRDFDKAERMFTKALRMNASDSIQDCLIKVQREKEKILEEEKSRKADEVFKAQRNSEMVTNQEKAEQFVSLALRAFELEANYTAEKYLIKALYLRPSDTTADILAEVRESINKNIWVRSNKKKKSKQKNNDEQEKEKEMKIEANKYLKTAEEQLARGDLINAHSSAIISDSFFRSEKSEQLLHRISELQFNAEKKKKKKIQDYIIFKSEFYIESAKIAIANGDIKLAEKYLRHSDKIKPSVTAKTLLQEVLTANNCDQNPSTSRQTGGGVLSKFFNWSIPSFF